MKIKIIKLGLLILFLTVFSKEAAAYPHFLGNKVVCPVTGEAFGIEANSKKMSYKGKVYYFCCLDCVALFKADPNKYLQSAGKEKEDNQQGAFSCSDSKRK
ncbi:MAG: YHS domain-containing protein [Candidatus Omnitrophota bacterium]|nr:YHS domain-containing protein [Candidatus Omnitrophota bacterium]